MSEAIRENLVVFSLGRHIIGISTGLVKRTWSGPKAFEFLGKSDPKVGLIQKKAVTMIDIKGILAIANVGLDSVGVSGDFAVIIFEHDNRLYGFAVDHLLKTEHGYHWVNQGPGGLDAFVRIEWGKIVIGTFDYGQTHGVELNFGELARSLLPAA